MCDECTAQVGSMGGSLLGVLVQQSERLLRPLLLHRTACHDVHTFVWAGPPTPKTVCLSECVPSRRRRMFDRSDHTRQWDKDGNGNTSERTERTDGSAPEA